MKKMKKGTKIFITAILAILLVGLLANIAINFILQPKCSPWAEKYFSDCGIKTTMGKDASDTIDSTQAIAIAKYCFGEAKIDSQVCGDLTKGKVANILVDVCGGNTTDSQETVFITDIIGHQYEEDIQKVVDSGLILPSKYNYYPDDYITAEQYLMVMCEAAKRNAIPLSKVGEAFSEVLW